MTQYVILPPATAIVGRLLFVIIRIGIDTNSMHKVAGIFESCVCVEVKLVV